MNFLYRTFIRSIFYIVIVGCYALYITWAKMQSPINPMVEIIVQGDNLLNDTGQIYCRNLKHTYRWSNSDYFKYSQKNQIGTNTYRIRLKMPCSNDVTRLRFDPLMSSGSLNMVSFRIHSNIWQDVDLKKLSEKIKPLSNISQIEYSKKGILIKASGEDPYLELTNDLQSFLVPKYEHYHSMLLKYFINTYLSVMLLLFLANLALKNGLKITKTYSSIKSKLDAYINKGFFLIFQFFKSKVNINLLVVAVSFFLFTAANFIFYQHLFSEPNVNTLLIFLSFVLLYCLPFLLYFVLLQLFNKWFFLRVLLGFLLLLTGVGFLADMTLFTLNGMHINHGFQMLFSGGASQFIKNLAFTKLSWLEINMYLGLTVLGVVFCWLSVWFFEKRLKRFNLKTNLFKMVLITSLCVFVIYQIQVKVYSQLTPHKLDIIETNHGFYYPLVNQKNYILSYPIQTKKFKNNDNTIQVDKMATLNNSTSKIFIFIFESLREDTVNDEVMPNLNEFKNNSWHFSRAISSGNATHYGWYSIINSKNPYYWERYNNLKNKKGSPFLRLLKDRGYKINVYTAKDLSYLNSNKVLFGESLDLPTYISDHPKLSPPEHDKRIIKKLIEDISLNKKEGSLNLIFLDSSHYPYRWAADEIEEFKPYVGTANKGVNLTKAKQLVKENKELIYNRYKNSNKFSDKLFGQAIDAINSSKHAEDSIVFAIGDHGQQFLEHSYLLHGFTLFREDIHIPFYIKGAKAKAYLDPQTATQIDVFPTLLDMLDIDFPADVSDGVSLLDGKQSYGISAAAGMQNTPYSYVAENPNFKLFFHIEKNNPINSKTLYVDSVFTHDDKRHIPKDATKDAYQKFINKEFPGFPQSLNFIEP